MSGFLSCIVKIFNGIGMHTCEKMNSRESKNIFTWIERREHQAVSHVYIKNFWQILRSPCWEIAGRLGGRLLTLTIHTSFKILRNFSTCSSFLLAWFTIRYKPQNERRICFYYYCWNWSRNPIICVRSIT